MVGDWRRGGRRIMSARRMPDARTVALQQAASDPRASAWVSAHAGSGKTHVLASRVIRLLLDGVPPARILCLTFTKAAAANMSARIFDTLARWALDGDVTLRTKIAALETGLGTGTVDIGTARRLFATAVETPGGLKIQTIHAFCERLLHLFPFEANVPADFRLIDEIEAVQLMERARNVALSQMTGEGGPLRESLARVAAEASGADFATLVTRMIALRHRLDMEPAARREVALHRHFGLQPHDDEATVAREILEGGIAREEWPAIAARVGRGSPRDRDCARRLRGAAAAIADADAVDAYFDVFFRDGEPRSAILTNGLRASDPDLAARIDREAARIIRLREKWLAAAVVARTIALDRVCDAVIGTFQRMKAAAGALDFEDLVMRTDRLLHHAAAADWVLYKLDGGIDHILVDEAQDTSEPQWRILEALAREFTAGAGRPGRSRTFFAVGDEKQSIFSFQGAAPAMFDAMRRAFERRVGAAALRFDHVVLNLSFRSSPDILAAVDAVFADARRGKGLTADGVLVPHEALKADVPGLVELWPLVAAEAEPDKAEWVLPFDVPGRSDPAVQLAMRIAERIRQMIAPGSGQTVAGDAPGTRRPVAPGDVMILVRKRGPLFHALVRALKEARVPVAGADRIGVTDHIAVMDCMAAGRAALLPDDDLTLATVLKSPLVGLDDDDLIALAPRRKGSLHAALVQSPDLLHRAAATRIEEWQRRAAVMTPFDFFSALLGPDGGRRAFVARMGEEANDALDEFLALALAHERETAPSLTTFLADMSHLSLDIRRDLESAADAVRIMTVHGAKGLESKIVFLPDTCTQTTPQRDDMRLLTLKASPAPLVAWAGRKDDDPAPLAAARRQTQEDIAAESRRLFYVAMTRAEERLYIAGFYVKRKPPDDCWYALAREALAPLASEIADPLDAGAKLLRIGAPPGENPLPAWLQMSAPSEIDPGPPLRPSSALAAADRREQGGAAAAAARLRGIAVHALLRRLPDIAPAARAAAGRAVLAAWPALSADHEGLLASVEVVLSDPALAPLFGAASLAEVPIAARLARGGGRPPVELSGQIDRLAETEAGIVFADYKTGAPPDRPPQQHVTQVALYAAALREIYPGRPVQAFLVYTDGPRAVALDDGDIAAALGRVLAAPAGSP
jgi:ATP-dependent helicase/nuclease subunit A